MVERVGTKLVVGGGLLIASIGLVAMSRVPPSDGYNHLLLAMILMTMGMGLVMAPATESIMGSLPPSKAGVGSAMNDTTRQMGGALGVAILGSIAATSYRPGIADKLSSLHLSSADISAAKDSVGGAMDLAKSLPASVGSVVATAAKLQFVSGMHTALVIGAGVVLIAAIIVFVYLPARAGDARESVEGALDGLASLTFAEAEGVLEVDAEASLLRAETQ